MVTYDAGHIESQSAWPDPLENTGLWRVGTFALPVAMLSSSSAAVLATVFGILELFGREQELFVLPFPGTSIAGAAAALLSWIVVYRCGRRPGRRWPRIWALTLATLNTVIALLGLLLPDRAWLLTLAVAGLAAAIALLPRLASVPPNSAMVQRIAPLSLAVALLIVPSACAVRHAIAQKTAERVDARIRQLHELTASIREATSYDWSRVEDSPEAAQNKTNLLATLSIPNTRDDKSLWHSATLLGKDEDLFGAMKEATEATVAGFEPARVPRVSNLREAAIHYDPELHQWTRNAQFPQLSSITGAYHQELGRIYLQLAPQTLSTESAGLEDYRRHYAEQQSILRDHLEEIAGSWTDNWAAFVVPAHDALIGRAEPSLRDVFRAPFAIGPDNKLTAGQLWQLTTLPLFEIKRLAAGSPGCEANDIAAGKSRQSRTPGCRCQDYVEPPSRYFRLDCYSYAPLAKTTEATLQAELRLVYKQSYPGKWPAWSTPAEVFFQFLPPEGADENAFRAEVMSELAAAVRAELPRGVSVIPRDRGGSVANGFFLQSDFRAIEVKVGMEQLIGLVPQKRALVVVVRTVDRAV